MALKIRLKKAVATGLVVGRQRVTVFQSGADAGPVELELGDKSLAQLLEELDDENLLAAPVVAAVDPSYDFLVTKRGKKGQETKNYLEYLQGQVEGGLVSHTTDSGPGYSGHRTLHAFPSQLVKPAAEVLNRIFPGQCRMVPSSYALLHHASATKSAPKKWRAHLRVLVGRNRGMAMLLNRDAILARRIFTLPEGGGCGPVIAGLRGLIAHAEEELGLKQVDGLIVHVSEEQAAKLGHCSEELGLKSILAPPVHFGAPMLAEALTTLAHRKYPPAFDILEEMHQAAGGRPKFPLVAAAPALAAVALTAGWLHMEGGKVRDVAEQLRTEASILQEDTSTDVLSVDDRLDALRLETAIAHSFLAKRAFWSGILDDLPGILRRADTALYAAKEGGRNQVRRAS